MYSLFCRKNDLGGGTILDLGIYTIQLSLWVFESEPISVRATGGLNESGVDTNINAVLEFPNGGKSKIQTSSLEKLSNKAVIKGTKGQITVSAFRKSTTCMVMIKGLITFLVE